MPYGQGDNSQMQGFLGGLRDAFGGGQPPAPEDEELKRQQAIKLAALARFSGGEPRQQAIQIDPEKAAAIQRAFSR